MVRLKAIKTAFGTQQQKALLKRAGAGILPEQIIRGEQTK
jgi:hypothetical protein|nr:MAG TPA_asm: hypothetical protein [Caudoviricetes sp.]